MVIQVQYQLSFYPLGTEDGETYTVYPTLPDDDEDGQHGGRS